MNEKLLDSAAVGALLGINAATVRRYLYESGGTDRRYSHIPFPAPSGRIGQTVYWFGDREPEILAWSRRRRLERRNLSLVKEMQDNGDEG